MKTSEDGFTLVEILVAINLAFLALTVTIGAYLVIDKVLIQTIRKSELDYSVNQFMYNFTETLGKSENFEISNSQDSLCVRCSGGKTFVFGKTSMDMRGLDMEVLHEISGLEEFCAEIRMKDGSTLVFPEGGQLVVPAYSRTDKRAAFGSAEILSIILRIKKAEKDYSAHYYTPDISISRFNNL